jgi:hypothetical protein
VYLRQIVVAIASEAGRFDESCGDYREVASIAVAPDFRVMALWIHGCIEQGNYIAGMCVHPFTTWGCVVERFGCRICLVVMDERSSWRFRRR